MDQELKALQKFYAIVIDFLAHYSFQLLGAAITVLIGWFAAKYAYAGLLRLFLRHRLDVTLAKFISNVVKILILGAK